MNMERVEKIVSAVLYEGYVLYPYRPSSVKNRQRWTFGGLYPEAYSRVNGGFEPSSVQTECLIEGDESTTLEVKVRFLHIMAREVRELTTPVLDLPSDITHVSRPVASLWVGDKLFQTWQEAIERDAGSADLRLGDLLAAPHNFSFSCPGSREVEPLRSGTGQLAGAVVRTQIALAGSVSVEVEGVAQGLYKVRVRITNLTPWQGSQDQGHREERDDALLCTFSSTHIILSVSGGGFVSLFDPPAEYAEAVAACSNIGTWPVLVGEEGDRDMILSSPIILYDYPQIAPESPGDLFDGTEIDEILTLRIMTMTDEEKREMRAVDERARALLDRTESLTGEQMMNMHGTVRSLTARRADMDPEVPQHG